MKNKNSLIIIIMSASDRVTVAADEMMTGTANHKMPCVYSSS
jgi:hypothetical protein